MKKLIFVLTCLFLAIPCTAEVIVCFPMDSNPNWTTEGQWEFGVPQGGGGPQSYDPTSGYTGANVYGYNLAGNYANNIPEYRLTTTALNCALAENVKLSFWRWLGIESSLFDHAKVLVSNDNVHWTNVWVNGVGNLADSSWVYCQYDISAVADKQQTVFVRWCMGPTDFSNAYAGWNIDDVCLNGDILDALFISPSDSFASRGPEGGPFSPACKSYTLTNEGTSTVNWTAVGTQSWFDVTPGGGTLTPGASVAVEICINSTANTLAEGGYTDTVSFTNTNSGFSHLIDVMLYIGDAIYVPLQFPTIQSAINASSNGDTILVLDGTYTGVGNRDIDFNGRAITLKSVNGPESCIINCQGADRGFNFHSGENSQSIIEGFTIASGHVCGPGAGIYCNNSSPTITNCIISGNWSETDCHIPVGDAYGGGIYCNNSSPIISNCVIAGNNGSVRGGGIYCQSNSSPEITNCIITGNQSFKPNMTGAGGGMYNDQSNPILTNCTFGGNRSVSGGGMYNNSSNPVLTNCTFSLNYATQGMTSHYGGAMYNINSSPTLTNCTFTGNWAEEEDYQAFGGGIYNRGGAPMLTNCTFVGNWVSSPIAYGGGIYNWNGKPTLTNCILWGNSDTGGMDESAQIYTTGVGGPVINYSCIHGWIGSLGGTGNMGDDPCFADANNNDYHLKSQAGRWEPLSQRWVQDDVNSSCIDVGDPNSDWTKELWPHGKRINMGAYGGTPQASMSLSDTGNIADLNNDDKVDFGDLKLFTNKWPYQKILLSEDLDRNGFVDFDDFAIFCLQWPYP
jgi:hypothetical protein